MTREQRRRYAAQLAAVRKYTGDWFTPEHGYDARHEPTFGQRMAVLKYYRKVDELTAGLFQTYTPKRGEKGEAFNFTGQRGYGKFTKAIIRKLSPDQHLQPGIDKTRPKNHRFYTVDTTTGRRFFNVPAEMFNGDEIDAEFYRETLEEYAAEAEFFLISAGETYMWGAGGGKRQIANKLAEVFRNYSSTQFDAHDKNSSYYGNWFRGIVGFTSRFDVLPDISAARKRQREYKARHNIKTDLKTREILGYSADGKRMYGHFRNGTLVTTTPWEEPPNATPYSLGVSAFLNGHDVRKSPYEPGTANHRLWNRGWHDAARAHR